MKSKLLLFALLGSLAVALVLLSTRGFRNSPPQPAAAPHGHAHAPGARTDELPESAAPEGRSGSFRGPGPAAAASEGAPAPVSDFLVRGLVVDERGAPIAAARLVLSDHPSLPLEYEPESRADFLRRFRATSDARGAFEVSGLEPQAVLRLAARASGFAPLARTQPLTGSAAIVTLEPVVLSRGAILSGVVQDAAGRPVDGARLQPDGGHPTPAVLSDPQGRFRIDELACGPWRVRVSSAAHPEGVFEGSADQPGVEVGGLVFTLGRAAALAGRIVGAPEEELAALQVLASPARADRRGPEPGAAGLRAARVDASGAFELRGLEPEREYALRAFDDSGFDRRFAFLGHAPRSAIVHARSGETGVAVPYVGATTLTFRVLSARASEPLTEFTVRCRFGADGVLAPPVEPPPPFHPDGRVRIEIPTLGVAAGATATLAELAIDAPGFEAFLLRDVVLNDGGETDLGELRLRPSALVLVNVVDASSGAAVAGARVWLLRQDPRAPRGGLRILRAAHAARLEGGTARIEAPGLSAARSDAEGVARLDSLEGETCTLRVESERHGTVELADLFLPRGELVERTVRLPAPARVDVLVLDAAGTPLAGVQVDHAPPLERGQPFVPFPPGLGPRTLTDESGRVSFAALEAGVHGFRLDESRLPSALEAGAGGSLQSSRLVFPAEANWQEILVAPGEARALTLQVARKATLEGRVLERGEPLAGASLRLLPMREAESEDAGHGAPGSEARSNGSGEYRLRELLPGLYRLSVTHPRRSLASELEVRLQEGENRLDVALTSGRIHGRVTAEGKPLAGLRVSAQRADAGPFAVLHGEERGPGAATTDADGRYELGGLDAYVELVVSASGGGYQEGRSPALRLEPDETRAGVDLELAPGGALEVSVRLLTGGAVAGGLLRATYLGAEAVEPMAAVLRLGSARFEGCRPGPWRVRVERAFDEGMNLVEGLPEREIEVTVDGTARLLLER